MKSRIPLILVVAFLTLVNLATIPIFVGDDALSGIFAVLLTQPWASLFSGLLQESVEDDKVGGILLVGIGAVINAVLIYLCSNWIVRRKGTT